MLFTMLPAAVVVLAAWGGSAGAPLAPGDGMPELRKTPVPPAARQASHPDRQDSDAIGRPLTSIKAPGAPLRY